MSDARKYRDRMQILLRLVLIALGLGVGVFVGLVIALLTGLIEFIC
jgi:hypothetical protein